MAHEFVFTMQDVRKVVGQGRVILDEITLAFFPGAKIGVLGHNGAGKSSLLRIMAGLDSDLLGEARDAIADAARRRPSGGDDGGAVVEDVTTRGGARVAAPTMPGQPPPARPSAAPPNNANRRWNTNANLLYIDQPTGTGFSYGTGLDHDEVGVANDMYNFLQQFMQGHTKYQTLDFFAFGESYAGHYVPAVTHKIWQENQALKRGNIHLNLKGTSVGNGLTDPEIQYKYYPEMAVSTNGHKSAVTPAEHTLMEAAVGPHVPPRTSSLAPLALVGSMSHEVGLGFKGASRRSNRARTSRPRASSRLTSATSAS